jgi:hypothetical protein
LRRAELVCRRSPRPRGSTRTVCLGSHFFALCASPSLAAPWCARRRPRRPLRAPTPSRWPLPPPRRCCCPPVRGEHARRCAR